MFSALKVDVHKELNHSQYTEYPKRWMATFRRIRMSFALSLHVLFLACAFIYTGMSFIIVLLYITVLTHDWGKLRLENLIIVVNLKK